MKAMEYVNAARSKNRPSGGTYLRTVFSDFLELHGDRLYGDDGAVIGGLARLDGRPVTAIAIDRGADTKERIARNFGAAHPEGYRKALRLMKQAEKFGRPVVTFVDTAGAYCGIGAEERGQGRAIAQNLMEMMALQVPVVSVIVGEGGSGGALGLAVANQVWMLEKAVYSVISPEGCASILYKDPSKVEQAAADLKLTAPDLLRLGVIEKIIPETVPGSARKLLRKELIETLAFLCALSGETLAEQRYRKFREIGANFPTVQNPVGESYFSS